MATESVFGALGGALLLSEFMGLRGYAGAALMIIGIVVAQLGTPSARSADPEPLTSYT